MKNYKILGLAALGLALILFSRAYFRANPQRLMSLEQKVEEKKSDQLSNFSVWNKQSTFTLPFHFYFPNSLEIKETTAGKNYQFVESSMPETSVISLAVLSYPEFQADKKVVDASGKQQFGTTNAYGESLFEYDDIMYVVSVDKHDVLKFSSTDPSYIKVMKNMGRTVSTASEQPEIKIVNLAENYLFKVPAKFLESNRELSPFQFFGVEFTVKSRDGKNNIGRFYVSSDITDPSVFMKLSTEKKFTFGGQDYSYINTLKRDGMTGVIFKTSQSTDVERDAMPSYSAMYEKEGKYVMLQFVQAIDSTPALFNTRNYEMTQVFNSFRFLSDQEKMQ